MEPRITHSLMVNALIGAPMPSWEICTNLTRLKFMRDAGDQHNWRWEWCRDALETCTLQELQDAYNRVCGQT